MSQFPILYPHAAALGLPIVDDGPGFDVLELEAKLGVDRFQKLMAGVEHVFCSSRAGHYPKDHALTGYEVHCVYARDLEDFLSKEGK
jgi:hypothetical protein